jgi:hypothetical protein
MYVEGVAGTFNSYTLIVLLVDTTRGQAALDSLRVYDSVQLRSIQIVGARFVQAHWSWLQLYDWYRYLLYVPHPEPTFSGITETDIDEVQNHISLGFNTPADSALAMQQLAVLHPPAGLINLSVVPYAVWALTASAFQRGRCTEVAAPCFATGERKRGMAGRAVAGNPAEPHGF